MGALAGQGGDRGSRQRGGKIRLCICPAFRRMPVHGLRRASCHAEKLACPVHMLSEAHVGVRKKVGTEDRGCTLQDGLRVEE